MREIKVGLLGLGTVGSGVLKMIQENGDKITNVTGQRITVKTALVRNPAKHEAVADSVTLTTDFAEILNDEEIDIAVELLGGLHPAEEYITALLKQHKHVVTANKDLIAAVGPRLAQLAHDNHCDLMYEASVAGGIPILRTIANSFSADQILEVKGIVNGTTNYILTQMAKQGLDYDTALKQAQELGFAEADPTNDVKGKDAAFKMVILSHFAFGTEVAVNDLQVLGIDQLTKEDVAQASKLGYVVKLVGLAKVVNHGLFVEVAPTLVNQSHPLASINNENNAVMVTGQAVGDTLFYGPGAGGLPTANSVLSDITSTTKNLVLKTTGNSFNNFAQELGPADPKAVSFPYYLSLKMPDVPGQMQQLAGLMTQVGASFQQLVQTAAHQGHAHVVVITHAINQAQLAQLKELLDQSPTLSLQAAYKVLD